MTDNIQATDIYKKNQPLTSMQKFMFGLVCWGVLSRSLSQSFHDNGYVQKYIDSKKAMKTGLVVYGVGVTLFLVTLLFLR